MTLRIREARQADLPSIINPLAEMDGETPMPLARAKARSRDDRRYRALEGEQVIATFFDALVHGGAREALTSGMVVTAARRGQDIGKAMLREGMRIVAGAGCYKMVLSSNRKRADAHRFYQSLGFRPHSVSFSINPSQRMDEAGSTLRIPVSVVE